MLVAEVDRVVPPEIAPSEPAGADEELWDRLVQYVEDGAVVPIVGQELLTVTIDGAQVQLYDYVAGRLAQRLRVDLPAAHPPAPLNWVASRYLEQNLEPEPERIYAELQRIFREIGTIEPSETLKKLAAIKPLRVFISTTFDSLLTRAISGAYPGFPREGEVVSFSPDNPQDLPEEPQPDRPVAYHLLGRLSSMQDYVVTEEDALEFLHHLLFSARPKRLFTHIQRRNLLIVGCSFPTWIVRFFIRAARERRLLLARGKMDVVVDSGTREDLALVSFLQRYKTRTEVIETGSAAEFVEELHRRWLARQPAAGVAPAPAARTSFVRPGAIFLSYASEDRAFAITIKDRLEAAGMDVWFDRHDLEPGDDYARKIRFTIEACSVFVPVLSRSCLTEARRWFRLEWDSAARESRKSIATGHFIVPIVIDDVNIQDPGFPDEFRARQATPLVQGTLPDAFVQALLLDYRQFQKRRGGL